MCSPLSDKEDPCPVHPKHSLAAGRIVKILLEPARDGALSGPPSPIDRAAEPGAFMEHLLCTTLCLLSNIHPATVDANLPTQEMWLRMIEGLGDSHVTGMMLIG